MYRLRRRRNYADTQHRRIACHRGLRELDEGYGVSRRQPARSRIGSTMMSNNQPHPTTTEHNAPFPLGQQHRLFIGGEWIEASEQVEIRFPYDRPILVGRVAWADLHHVNHALQLAQPGP